MLSQGSDQKSIMVVEDHDDSRLMMQILLESDGFQVFTAANGRQAVKLAGELQPDAILMDLNLPHCDGLAATKQIRRNSTTHNIPIIALTAYDMSDSRDRALAAGCTEFMLKPVDFEKLAAVLERVMSQRGTGTGTAGREQIESARPKTKPVERKSGQSAGHLRSPRHLFEPRRSARRTF